MNHERPPEVHTIRVQVAPTTRTDLLCVRCGRFRTEYILVGDPGAEEVAGVHRACLRERSPKALRDIASGNFDPVPPPPIHPVFEPTVARMAQTICDEINADIVSGAAELPKPRRQRKPKKSFLDELEEEERELLKKAAAD